MDILAPKIGALQFGSQKKMAIFSKIAQSDFNQISVIPSDHQPKYIYTGSVFRRMSSGE
jgi:hypothetical protein